MPTGRFSRYDVMHEDPELEDSTGSEKEVAQFDARKAEAEYEPAITSSRKQPDKSLRTNLYQINEISNQPPTYIAHFGGSSK